MDPEYEKLWRRAQRAFGDRTPAEAIEVTRAIVGPGVIPDSQKNAQTAMEKLHNGVEPEPDEMLSLGFVIRVMRPAPLSHGGLFDALEAPGSSLHPHGTVARWDAFRYAVQPLVGSVGCIESDGKLIGTGFLVRADVLTTNRHVLDLLTGGTGILAPGTAKVYFHRELGAQEPPLTRARLLHVLHTHPQLDIALFAIEPSADRPPLPLDFETVVDDGHPVAVVGYPAEPGVSNPAFGEAVFGMNYGVRRGAPGEVMDPALPLLFHDCSTLGGNSGSPVFSLLSHRVIGIHRSGWFTYRNEAVGAAEIRNVLDA